MLKLKDFEAIFLTVSLLGSVAIASPALAFAFPGEKGEKFSELYILGSNRMVEDYPSKVKVNETYRIFLGIANRMGSSSYYAVYVKLRAQGEPLPNSTSGMASPLPTVWEFRLFLGDDGIHEEPLNISLGRLSNLGNRCTVEKITVNGLDFDVNKTVYWDSENVGFYLELLFELWMYNVESNLFSYQNRFVGIWLNVTR